MNMTDVPVITIDGPAAAGKSTVSCLLSQRFSYHILVSGSLYRVIAWLSLSHEISADNVDELIKLAAATSNVKFLIKNDTVSVHFNSKDISQFLAEESCANRASQLASIPRLRAALLGYQRRFKQSPGLIADGRDMGTIVFPDAFVKIFLTASLEERALRRCRQLNNNGFSGNLAMLKQQLKARDARDASRKVAPLIAAEDAVVVDTTNKTAKAVVEGIIALIKTQT